jgi:hypothetical protein
MIQELCAKRQRILIPFELALIGVDPHRSRISAPFSVFIISFGTDPNYSSVAKGGITSGINPSPASAA